MFEKIIFLLIFLSSFFGFTQVTTHPMLSAGFVYQNLSFLEVGGKVLFLKNDDWLYRLGAGGLLGNTQGKWVVIPKLQGDILFNKERNVDIFHSTYTIIGTEITPYYISPKTGLSIFGIVDLSAGYSFSFNKNGIKGKDLKGFNFAFTVSIPFVVFQK